MIEGTHNRLDQIITERRDVFHVKKIKLGKDTYYDSYKDGKVTYYFHGVQEGYTNKHGRQVTKPFLLYTGENKLTLSGNTLRDYQK